MVARELLEVAVLSYMVNRMLLMDLYRRDVSECTNFRPPFNPMGHYQLCVSLSSNNDRMKTVH